MTIWANGTSFNSASVATMPSMSGMLMSMRTTSGWVSWANWMASSPERAEPTIWMSVSNCRSLRMFSRVSAISSTISRRILSPSLSVTLISVTYQRRAGKLLLHPLPTSLARSARRTRSDQCTLLCPLGWLSSRRRYAVVAEDRRDERIQSRLQPVGKFAGYGDAVIVDHILKRHTGRLDFLGVARGAQRESQVHVGFHRPVQGQGVLGCDDQGDNVGRWCR